jgi:hypothetical protein
MRLRTAKDRLKVEHSIIGGVREILEALIEARPEIRPVITVVIRPVRDANGAVRVLATVPAQAMTEYHKAMRRRAIGEGLKDAVTSTAARCAAATERRLRRLHRE